MLWMFLVQVSDDGRVSLKSLRVAASCWETSNVDANHKLGDDGATRLARVLSEAPRPLLMRMQLRSSTPAL